MNANLATHCVKGIVVDGCGRRWTICCTASLLVLGSVVSTLATSYPLLLCGRLVGGFAGALSAVAQCIYAAEISEPQSRGRAVLFHQLGVAAGLLLSSIAGTGSDTQWRMVVWLSAIPAIIEGLVALIFLPDSPQFRLLQTSQNLQTKPSPTGCALGNLAETLLLAFGLVFLQQFSGRPAALYYAPRVFLLLGVCPDATFTVAAIILNVIKVGAVSLSLCVVDKIGRRPSLIVGVTCMMTSIALLGLISAMEENEVDLSLNPAVKPCGNMEMGESVPVLPSGRSYHYAAGIGMSSPLLPTGVPPPFPLLPTPVSLVGGDPYASESPWCPVSVDTSLSPSLRYLALFALICYEIAYSFGFGPVTWLLLTEIFPASVKGRAVSLTTSLHWFADLIIPATFTYFISAISLEGVFFCHSVVCLNAIFFVFLFIPETGGKSLHQIVQGIKSMSYKTRMFQNLQGLPCLSKSTWLQQKARQYRQVSHATVESTII
ncbi:solute carrier family 2, facilitated glucose transporter member 10-like isoform X2 [Zootermopsis nevadensis]|uniref:solute carrier family 2, facilitated glucose transporter member 10-like isoform X2 n=1 Tax=Zootermopsis nevadensis TaxID=136037 RepID=UPI000B8EA801|nr:solute carrier family 2, facilitated glucose transporter member 10-like isoform X2 [Zootermopsis nevadensis]